MDQIDVIEEQLTGQAWQAVAGPRPQPGVDATGEHGPLAGVLPSGPAAVACVSGALLAAAELAGQRAGRTPAVALDREHVAHAVRSERPFTVDGAPAGAGFAPLSRFWPVADGWVRTHANYAWHRAALLQTLGVADDRDEVAAAMAGRTGADIEAAVVGAGGIAVQVRTAEQWLAHPQASAVRQEPLVGHDVVGPAAPRTRPPADLPAAGVRVLDLTRVIAGPVCTRVLGALGADVLRVDPTHKPDLTEGSFADTLLGKRSAALDLADGAARDDLHRLLADADVVVLGYRPGSLDRFGLTDAELAERHPGLVIVRLCAWGHTGPWAGRRGFDSVVQAGIGIARAEAPDGTSRGASAHVTPGALPCQLLDHGTGYLAAAAALDGLRRQSDDGGTRVRRLSLARTGMWLLDAPRSAPRPPLDTDPGRWLTNLGPVTAVAPPGALDGRPLTWPGPPARFLADLPEWRPAVTRAG